MNPKAQSTGSRRGPQSSNSQEGKHSNIKTVNCLDCKSELELSYTSSYLLHIFTLWLAHLHLKLATLCNDRAQEFQLTTFSLHDSRCFNVLQHHHFTLIHVSAYFFSSRTLTCFGRFPLSHQPEQHHPRTTTSLLPKGTSIH